MVSPESTNWMFDCGAIDDIPVPYGNFQVSGSGFSWPVQAMNGSSIFRSLEPQDSIPCSMLSSGVMEELGVLIPFFEPFNVEDDGSLGDSDGLKEGGSKKRIRSETCGTSSSKACREKLRRDRLNDKFMVLGSILEPGRPAKTDKAAILIDAVRMVTRLRGEAQKLKESNSNLQEKIKESKVEKNDLREEKQRLKAEKEKLEQQLKTMNTQPSFLPAPPPPVIPTFGAVVPHGQAPPPGNKLVPFISYPGVAMWQFMPPATVDTSQDHVLRPPVA